MINTQPAQISSFTADQLVRSVDKLCDYVEKGDHPTSAASKVASENGMHREQIRLLCQGYNTGVINATRRDGKSFGEKFAAVPLAQADEAIERVFSGKAKPIVKTAGVAAVYRTPAENPAVKLAAAADTADKVAASLGPMAVGYGIKDRRTPYELATEKIAELRELRNATQAAGRKATQKLAAIHDAYRGHYGNNNDSLLFLRKWASDVHGDTGRILVDQLIDRHVTNTFERDKFAAATKSILSATSPHGTAATKSILSATEPRRSNHPVMLAIKEAIDSLQDWVQKESALPLKALEIGKQARELYPVADAHRPASRILPPGVTAEQRAGQQWDKKADIFSAAIGSAGSRLAGGGGGVDDFTPARLKLNDPRHQATIRRLQAEATLNRLVNMDDVIGSYDPQSVADSWYELNESSPGVVNNLGLLRANLRRHLQGNLTPYEADAMVRSGKDLQPSAIPAVAGLTDAKASNPPSPAKKS